MSVYFIRVGPVVKVGFSEDPERRLKRLFAGTTLYTAPAVALEHRTERHILRVIDGCKSVERAIHDALSDFNIGLEWFVAEQPVLDFGATARKADTYARLVRTGGPVRWAADQMAGGNAALVMAAHRKRQERLAALAHAP